MKQTLRTSLFLLLVLMLASSSIAFASGKDGPAPLVGENAPNAIPGRYIVVFSQPASDQAVQSAIAQTVKGMGGQVYYTYTAALKGFAASLPTKAVEALRQNPNVAYIAVDQVVSLAGTQLNPPSWGLDRIDQHYLPVDSRYAYDNTGSNVRAYIIDTGIRITHNEFDGERLNRAIGGFTSINDGNGTNDCNGHGTHVSATVGGTTYGVAKGVTLYAVRVLDCNGSGSYAGVIAGVDWVTNNHLHPAVANMSLGGGAYQPLDDAITNSINHGVVYAVAAGNSNDNACNYSPARTPAAITVGATDSTDARAGYSNYGACVDLFAPGSNITSAWNTSDTATNTISGTSMASPHVAGAAAIYLQCHQTATAQQVRDALVRNATNNVVTNPGAGSPNKLLFTIGLCCEIDLTTNTYTCTLPGVTMVTAPAGGQVVVKVNSTETLFDVTYGTAPTNWTVNIGDSATNNGWAGDAGTQSRDAEMQVLGTTMSVYANDHAAPPGMQLASVNTIASAGSMLTLRVKNEYLQWDSLTAASGWVTSPYLYALAGQIDNEGPINYDIYAGFNRTIGTSSRSGTGVTRVTISIP